MSRALHVIVVLVVTFTVAYSTPARAEFRRSTGPAAQNIKRWSLEEWLEQRDRMRMMDLWLALHTPSPFEFYFSGAYYWGDASDKGYYGSYNLAFAAYATIFGLEIQREFSNRDPRMHGMFHLRIFGPRAQGMNITLQGGARYDERSAGQLWIPTFALSFAIYITRHFGFEGLYKHYFETNYAPTGQQISGKRYEIDAFIDFKFVRVFGGYFYEVERDHGVDAHLLRGGFGGLKLFF